MLVSLRKCFLQKHVPGYREVVKCECLATPFLLYIRSTRGELLGKSLVGAACGPRWLQGVSRSLVHVLYPRDGASQHSPALWGSVESS